MLDSYLIIEEKKLDYSTYDKSFLITFVIKKITIET